MNGAELAASLGGTATLEAEDHSEIGGVVQLDGNQLVYTVTMPRRHAPDCRNIVICESWFEAARMQRSQMDFLRSAATRGYAGIYLQPPGSGDSDGREEDLRLAQRLDAADSATEILADVTGARDVCYVGLRVGGSLALIAGGKTGSAAAAWDPVLDDGEYWRQMNRLWAIARMRTRGQVKKLSPQEELNATGETLIGGTRVVKDQAEELGTLRTLITSKAAGLGPALLLAGRDLLDQLPAEITDRPDVTLAEADLKSLDLRLGFNSSYPKVTLDWLDAQ